MFTMRTFIILILGVSLSVKQTSAQLPNYFQAGSPPGISSQNNWPNSGLSRYQPYRAPTSQSSPGFSISSGQYQSSPQLSTIAQLSGYSRLSAAAPQNNPWTQYQATGPRSWSVPSPVRSYAGLIQPPSNTFAGYTRPTPLNSPLSTSTSSQVQGTPFQNSWSINHQAPSSLTVAQPQTYNNPTPVASPATQNWSPQPAPIDQWSPPTTQTYSAPQPAPVSQWTPSPTQTYSAPQPAPVSQWRPPPTQTYTTSQPAPPQSTPASTYQSPQNAQNQRPAPVHYANIGAQLQGDYKFGYHTGDGGSFREETRLPDGTVQGAYGFIDADGKQRVVKYRAGKDGFQAEGDDVPKGAPVNADQNSTPSQQQTSAPINIDEGAAFRSFSQG